MNHYIGDILQSKGHEVYLIEQLNGVDYTEEYVKQFIGSSKLRNISEFLLFKASLQRHLEKLPSMENGDASCSSEGEMSDDTDSSAHQFIETSEIMEKLFRIVIVFV